MTLPVPDRLGAATLVEASQEKLLFDAGRGATIRRNEIRVPIGALNAVFLTHFHSDHTDSLPVSGRTSRSFKSFGYDTASRPSFGDSANFAKKCRWTNSPTR